MSGNHDKDTSMIKINFKINYLIISFLISISPIYPVHANIPINNNNAKTVNKLDSANYYRAIDDYTKAISINTNYIDAYNNNEIAIEKLKNNKETIKYSPKDKENKKISSQLDKNQSKNLEWLILQKKGTKLLEDKDFNSAEKILNHAYSLAVLNNNKIQIYQSLAVLADLYRDEYKNDIAIEYYEKSLNLQEELLNKGQRCSSYVGTKYKLEELKNGIRNNENEDVNKVDNLDLNSYVHCVERLIYSKWQPPKNIEYKKIVTLIHITRNGKLISVTIKNSSGNTMVDQAALDAVKKAAPFPPMPKEYKYKDVNLEIYFEYNIYINNESTNSLILKITKSEEVNEKNTIIRNFSGFCNASGLHRV